MAKNGYKVFDSDLHLMEPWDLWLRYIEPKYKDQAPVGTTEVFMDGYLKHEGRVINRAGVLHEFDQDLGVDQGDKFARTDMYRAFEKRGWDASVMLEAMDMEGIDKAVMYPTRGLYALSKEYDDDNLASAIARAYNNWLAEEFCAKAPERMYGAGLVAVQDVDGAVAEVRRMKQELGFRAIYLRPNPVRGRNWHNPCYDPFWAELEKQHVVVGFHEGIGGTLPVAVGERFDGRHEDTWITEHVACHPVEMMYASLCVTAGGVCERFPGLKIAFLEANCSWVPYWIWRMDEHYEHRERHVKKRLPRRPSEYFMRQCWAAIEADEELGEDVVKRIGDGNIVFSTDFPHEDSRFPTAVETLLELKLPKESFKKILWDNSARLYEIA